MRKNYQKQLSLTPCGVAHQHAKELEALGDLLDSDTAIVELIAQDLIGEGVDPQTGRPAMSAEQTLRAALLRQMGGLSYEALAFFLADSRSAARFCRLGFAQTPPSKSTLQRNIKRITAQTWEALNRRLVATARRLGVERGDKVRVDCTVVNAPIHHPTDSSLLFDTVRVLARLMGRAREHCAAVAFSNRTRRAKRRMLEISRARKSAARRKAYADLVEVTIETLQFAHDAVVTLEAFCRDRGRDRALQVAALRRELAHYSELGWRVLEQTHERVFEERKVAAADKVVSIFEEHTDVIVKDRRETLFGHKVCLSTGTSSLVLDCVVLDGNPADSTLVETMLGRHVDIVGKPPRQAAFDGGFASRANLELAKDMGVRDVMFHKKRGLQVSDMARSEWIYKRLRRFRAGVEGCISWLKRSFGMARCRWRGLASFKSYVWASVVACNLLILARHALH